MIVRYRLSSEHRCMYCHANVQLWSEQDKTPWCRIPPKGPNPALPHQIGAAHVHQQTCTTERSLLSKNLDRNPNTTTLTCKQTAGKKHRNVAPANLQKCVGGFLLYKIWRIFPGIFLEDFLGTFSHKNEEKKSGQKIREKIRRLKNKNPRKIRSAESRP